jgi:transketolase
VRDAFIAELIELAKRDDRIALLTGDLGFGVVEKFAEEFPNRFWNCGVAEQSMMSIAAGLAKSGMRPFVYSIANFPTFRCLEQIRNDVCYHNLPVTIVSVGGGLGYGTLGYTHHGIEDVASIRSLPNISIYSPADPIETSEVLHEIHREGRPAYLRLGKNGEPKIDEITKNKISGKIHELKAGEDLTVISCGAIVNNCLMVANEIKPEFNVQVISVPKIHTLDAHFLDSIISSEKILVVEEHVERGGLASSVLESFNKLGSQKKLSHNFVQESKITNTGSQEYLRGLSGLDKSSLKSAYLQIIRS